MVNIIETVTASGNFTNLLRAIQQAGLTEMISGTGPITLFAPNDQAFAKLPSGMFDKFIQSKDQLRSLISYHIVQGRVLVRGLKGSIEPKSLMGETLLIRPLDGKVVIGDAKVVQRDIPADNGVIQVIDAIVVPKLMKQKVA